MSHPVSERIAVVAPSAAAAAVVRRSLIAWLSTRGHRVLCITPPGPGRYSLVLRGLGAQHRIVEPPEPTIRVLTDWQNISGLVSHLSDWQPNIVLGVGLETLTMAAIAARRSGVRRVVSLVNGLPSDGIESVGRRRFTHALRQSDAVVFHNRDNLRTLTELDVLPANIQTLVVPGSGVDLERFRAMPMPALDEGAMSFLMVGRLERRRGVLEYQAAARMLKARWPAATFRFAGPASDATDSVAPDKLTEGGAVEYLGDLEDVRPALAACHVFVYPSYGEGLPLQSLEALATGRPVITTTAAGCAETVDEKVSGCLVPPADAEALAVAMESYLANPEQLAYGTRGARLKAERRFDTEDVNAAMAQVLGVA